MNVETLGAWFKKLGETLGIDDTVSFTVLDGPLNTLLVIFGFPEDYGPLPEIRLSSPPPAPRFRPEADRDDEAHDGVLLSDLAARLANIGITEIMHQAICPHGEDSCEASRLPTDAALNALVEVVGRLRDPEAKKKATSLTADFLASLQPFRFSETTLGPGGADRPRGPLTKA